MPLLVRCPDCKKLISAAAKVCESKTGKGCGAKIPAGKRVYYAYWRDPNGRVKQKKIGPSRQAAENFLRQVETAIAENKYIDKAKEPPRITVKDFCEEHYLPRCRTFNRSHEKKKYFVQAIIENFGPMYLNEVTDKDIDQYRWRMHKADKKVMFNRVLSVFSNMYTVAMEYGFATDRPFTTKGKRFSEKSRLRYLLPPEVDALVDQCPDHLRPIVLTALHTGMRKSEVLGLRLDKEVDLGKRIITLDRTKNDEKRHIPINDTLFDILTDTVAAGSVQPGERLFKYLGSGIANVQRSFSTAVAKAEIEDFHFHDLRHTFASNLVMSGVDLFVVKELLGHKDIKQTMIYAHLSPHHQGRAVSVLDTVFGAKKSCTVAGLPGTGHQSYVNQPEA